MNGKGMTPAKGYNHAAYRDNYDAIFMSKPNLVMGHAAFVPHTLREALAPTTGSHGPVRPTAAKKRKPTPVTPKPAPVKARPIPVRKRKR